MPIYINMVRDPIEKAISWFYYIRSAPYLNNVKRKIDPNEPTPDVRWMEKVQYCIFYILITKSYKKIFLDCTLIGLISLQSYDNCVDLGDSECTYIEGRKRRDYAQLTDYFCGHHDYCE